MSQTIVLANSAINWGAWKFTGNLTSIDLVAATTNALNGAILQAT